MWYHSLDIEALICYNTALDYHILDVKVPEMLTTGQAADISHIREYAWFDWVIFCDGPHVLYPNKNLVLGRYLGPTLNVGSAMCAKMLKRNGKVVPRSTLRALTREEIDSPVHKEQRRQFVTSIITCLGPSAITWDFPEDHSTPVYEIYADN